MVTPKHVWTIHVYRNCHCPVSYDDKRGPYHINNRWPALSIYASTKRGKERFRQNNKNDFNPFASLIRKIDSDVTIEQQLYCLIVCVPRKAVVRLEGYRCW